MKLNCLSLQIMEVCFQKNYVMGLKMHIFSSKNKYYLMMIIKDKQKLVALPMILSGLFS